MLFAKTLPAKIRRPIQSIPPLAWMLLLTVGCLAPFSGKAFFIDDTLFLRAAEQIAKHPADFYGFSMNWSGVTQPMIEVFENPPLTSYFIALVASIAGWREPVLHLAFLLPALAAAWGIFVLAKSFCQQPALAAAAAILTPVFLISGTTLMADVLLLALWVCALVSFERGLEAYHEGATEGRFWRFVAAGVLAGLAVLTKFTGLGLVPLMLAYGLARKRRVGWWILAPLLPVLAAGLYEWLTWRLYGHGHMLAAVRFSSKAHSEAGNHPLQQALLGLAFAGGCFLPVSFFAPFLWSRRWILPLLVLVLASLVYHPQLAPFARLLAASGAVNWAIVLQSAVFVAAGAHLLLLACADLWQRRESGSLLLALWTAGVFIFAGALNWTVSGRSLLPLAPALGILVARRLEWREKHQIANRKSEIAKLCPLVGALIISLLLVKADCNTANSSRRVAKQIWSKYQKPGQTVWFQGHWGFQYYAEELGGRPLDFVHPGVKSQDLLVVPSWTPSSIRPDPRRAVMAEAPIKSVANRYCSTMSGSVGAAFYSSTRGPLPFGFGSVRPDVYLVFAFR